MWKIKIGPKTDIEANEIKIQSTLSLYSIQEDWDKNGYTPDYKIVDYQDSQSVAKILKEQIKQLRQMNDEHMKYATTYLSIDLILLTACDKYAEYVCLHTDKKNRN